MAAIHPPGLRIHILCDAHLYNSAYGNSPVETAAYLADLQEWADATGARDERRAQRVTSELHRILAARLMARATEVGSGADFAALRADVLARRLDPWSAADRLLDKS